MEAHLSEVRVDQVFIKDSAEYYYNEVFNRYTITIDQFEASIKYYTADAENLKKIYEHVLDHLSEMEADLGEIKEEKTVIVPINKNVFIDILSNDSISTLFLEDSLDLDKTKDSIFKHFIIHDSILKKYNTNLASFEQSYHQFTYTPLLFHTLKDSIIIRRNRISQKANTVDK